MHITESHESGRIGHDDLGVLHADKGDKATQTHHDGVLDIKGDRVDDQLTDLRHRQKEENDNRDRSFYHQAHG